MTYNPQSRNTIMSKIQQLYGTEKQNKRRCTGGSRTYRADGITGLQLAIKITLVLRHTSSTVNGNSTMLKTETRHYADACAQQFLSVHGEFNQTSPQSAQLPYEHMACVAHMLLWRFLHN
ncbi:unnamed protein product [Menidia menidia]|uniref:(Atlantic silverside) hypothetical protein n=1 Tax=Menidia menidia TaxID=238744 RepID=A0A8S4C0U7_9TELE|nr:unnamed protein product [Menidia menidia]